jgi:N-acyl-D-amino-acid deacylase
MKKDCERFLERNIERRGFLGYLAKASLFVMTLPIFSMGKRSARAQGHTISPPASSSRVLLKNGLIVDGTGKSGYVGSLVMEEGKITEIARNDIEADGDAIDCTDRVIAPGFIDAHSHMDWYLPIEGYPRLKTPFIAQGITTFVAGNCGYGVAGFRPESPFMDIVESRTRGLFSIQWDTMGDYFDFLTRQGTSHNLVNLAGHGTTRTSIRGYDPSPLRDEELTELLTLFEAAMDQGAYGVSFGLQYEPGVFATADEIEAIARLVKKKDKVVTVHMKAYSTLSGTYPLKLLGEPHNLLAIKDMIEVTRKTDVRMQLSHLIFVGKLTWKNYERALALIDDAIASGLDVKFDTYAYHCGTSIINVFFPEWFLASIPEAYEDRSLLKKLKRQIMFMEKLLGFGYKDIQITYANHEELNQYNGMFIYDIAKERGMGQFENFIDIAKKSNGLARVLNHKYSNPEIVEALMKHPASLFMTDASVATEGVQNPASFGCFPKFLEDAREKKIISLEEAVYKMTGASRERFHIKDRGVLGKGLAADVTVFDWNSVRDNNTLSETDRAPTGIEWVFINGKPVVVDGVVDESVNAGIVVS